MFLQIIVVNEGMVADFANLPAGLEASMGLHVMVPGTSSVKPLVTYFADEDPLIYMSAHVDFQLIFSCIKMFHFLHFVSEGQIRKLFKATLLERNPFNHCSFYFIFYLSHF